VTPVLLSALVLLLPADASADASDLVGETATAFAEGLRRRQAGERSRAQFQAAAAACEELRRRGASNALLYRNLGNARLLASDLPGAILAYREGLRVEPGDAVLRRNLAAARNLVAFAEGSRLGRPPEDVRPGWLVRVGPGWVFALALAAHAAGWAALVRWLMRRRPAALVGAVALVGPAALGVGLLVRGEAAGQTRPVVVLAADGVRLRKGNSALFPPRYETPLNRGVEAELLFRRGGWLQVELAGGEVGWVPAGQALVEEHEG
jgi:hypothetical protein